MSALARRQPSIGRPNLLIPLLLLASVALGLAVAIVPMLATLPVVALGASGIVSSARFRMAFVVGGGLLTLQGSTGFDPPKLAYVAGCALCAVIALSRRRLPLTETQHRAIAPLERSSLIWISLIGLSYLVGVHINGFSLSVWVRDALPYLLFAAVPIFLRDIAVEQRSRGLHLLFVVSGLLAALAFFVTWVGRRGLASLPIDRVVLPTTLLAAALYAYAIARGAAGPNRLRWTFLAGLILALLLATATRTNLILLVGPFLVSMNARARLGARLARSAASTILLFLFLLVTATFVFALTPLDSSTVTDRLALLSDINNRNAVAGQSFDERAIQTGQAWRTFHDQPLTGSGPGKIYRWYLFSGKLKESFNLDSPISVLAKFGLLGAIAMLVSIIAYVRAATALRPQVSDAMAAALPSYLVILALWMAIGPVIEDKGTSFGLLMLFGLALREAAAHQQITASHANIAGDSPGSISVEILH